MEKEFSGINHKFVKKKKPVYSTEEYLSAIRAGNNMMLSQGITLIESKNSQHNDKAQEIIKACLPYSGNSIRLGITGTPGVGKSTFIDNIGLKLLEKGFKVAVLAVDPSSQISKGSILGDKTRMENLSVQSNVFIRPSAAGDSLGGVARKTREAIILCEAAGYDFVIVETVGVGQSETAVHSMTDFFLLLLLPNSGDELQGIKRGVMEMADLIAINKADGEAMKSAKLAQKQCRNGLHLFPPKGNDWEAKALTCSALNDIGVDKIIAQIFSYKKITESNYYWLENRKAQAKYWLDESITSHLKLLFQSNEKVRAHYQKVEKKVINGEITPFKAAEELINIFKA